MLHNARHIRQNLLWFAMVVTAALLQTNWPNMFKFQEVLPDLTLLLVIFFGIAEGEERAMFTGLIGGMYQDVAGDTTLGHHVLCNVVIGYIVGRMAQRLIADHPAIKVGLVFLSVIAHGMLFLLIQYAHTPEMQVFWVFRTTVLPTAFYTAAITPLVFYLLELMFRRPQESLQGESGP